MLMLQQVRAGYSGRQILNIDELRIEAGRITILIGRNGSGKSTLLRCVAGILPFKGEILVLNKNKVQSAASGMEDAGSATAAAGKNGEHVFSIRDMSHKERARLIGLLPQSQPAPEMNVETLVMHGRFSRLSWPGRPGKKDADAVNEAIDLCGIRELTGRSLPRLSGGERQLCYLAMVIAQDPQIILLDEPMSAMDISHQTKIMAVLRRLKEEGKTVVMTSHDLPQSFTLADKIALLREGRIAGEGTPEQLVGKPDLVRRTMGAAVAKAEGENLLYPYLLTN